jgi:diaminopimelate epimerase
VDGTSRSMDWGDIGVPHGVLWVDDVDAVPIERWGPHLRSHPAFGAEGTNVSFVQRLSHGSFAIRTFERGVEGETFACGSGSAVAATIARERGFAGDRATLRVRSGATLGIDLPDRTSEGAPALDGPVHRVFEGIFPFAQTSAVASAGTG